MTSAASSSGEIGGDESEDSSSSSAYSPISGQSPITEQQIDCSIVLQEFREKWQQEIKFVEDKNESNVSLNKNNKEETKNDDSNIEDKARALYLQGTELEKLGKVFEAMRLYRRALQMVPDIELKIYESIKTPKHKVNSGSNVTESLEQEEKENIDNTINQNDEDNENLDGVDLTIRFQTALMKSGRFFERANSDKSMILTGFHFSDLPIEIILYILRWVVSSELDMRSLELCSGVSKGFYLCARDPEIWKLACTKIWGRNIEDTSSLYSTWREMYLERHRLHFNGCYISKTSYLRYGENSYQDQFYRPLQLIEYYRYVRFFPDGKILMLTSAEDPAQCVNKLKSKHPYRNEVLTGNYRLHGDVVIIFLQKNRNSSSYYQNYKHQRRGSLKENETVENSQSFYIELIIASSMKRKFCQLQWKHYSIIQVKNTREISSDFELTKSRYPPFWFSRVKSYHSVSNQPLQ